MFWKAVTAGTGVLSHWQVWVGTVLSVLVMMGFQGLVAVGMRDKEIDEPTATGCLTMMLGGVLLQSVVNAIFFTMLIPIVLGGAVTLSVRIIFAHFKQIAIIGILGMAASILIGIIPIFARSQAVPGFVQGVLVCRLLAGAGVESVAEHQGTALLYPGLWHSIGFVIVAAIMGFLAIAVTSILLAVLGISADDAGPVLLSLMASLGLLSGYLSVFMYMRYAVLSMQLGGEAA